MRFFFFMKDGVSNVRDVPSLFRRNVMGVRIVGGARTRTGRFLYFWRVPSVNSTMIPTYQALTTLLGQARIFFMFLIGRVRLSFINVCVSITSISTQVCAIGRVSSTHCPLRGVNEYSRTRRVHQLIFQGVQGNLLCSLVRLFVNFSRYGSTGYVPVRVRFQGSLYVIHPSVQGGYSLIGSGRRLLFVGHVFRAIRALRFFFTPLRPTNHAHGEVFSVSTLYRAQ